PSGREIEPGGSLDRVPLLGDVDAFLQSIRRQTKPQHTVFECERDMNPINAEEDALIALCHAHFDGYLSALGIWRYGAVNGHFLFPPLVSALRQRPWLPAPDLPSPKPEGRLPGSSAGRSPSRRSVRRSGDSSPPRCCMECDSFDSDPLRRRSRGNAASPRHPA